MERTEELLDRFRSGDGRAYETLVERYRPALARFIQTHLSGELNHNDMVQKLNAAIRQFAKRQETWFRRMERKGQVIFWVDGAHPLEEQTRLVCEYYHASVSP